MKEPDLSSNRPNRLPRSWLEWDSGQSGKLGLRMRFLILGLSLVMVIVIGAWLSRRALALSYQIRAGELLGLVLQTTDEIALMDIQCVQAEHIDETTSLIINRALNSLQKAFKFNPRLAQAYLLSGRAYCLLGEPEKAVKAYRNYTRLRPQNPLGHLELGFGYEKLNSHLHAIREWQRAGYQVQNFLDEGNKAFQSGNYTLAYRWYQHSAFLLGQLEPSVSFRWAIAALVSGYAIPEQISPSIYNSYILEGKGNPVLILGKNLQWLLEIPNLQIFYGDPLKKNPGSDPSIGVMWWEGPTVAVVQASESKTVCITIRARHHQQPGAATGELQIEHNLIPLSRISLSDDWQEFRTLAVMEQGNNLLIIRYMKDVGDTLVDWIKVDDSTECNGS